MISQQLRPFCNPNAGDQPDDKSLPPPLSLALMFTEKRPIDLFAANAGLVIDKLCGSRGC